MRKTFRRPDEPQARVLLAMGLGVVFAITLSKPIEAGDPASIVLAVLLHGVLYMGIGALTCWSFPRARQHLLGTAVALTVSLLGLELIQGWIQGAGAVVWTGAAAASGGLIGLTLELGRDSVQDRSEPVREPTPSLDQMGDWWRWGHGEEA